MTTFFFLTIQSFGTGLGFLQLLCLPFTNEGYNKILRAQKVIMVPLQGKGLGGGVNGLNLSFICNVSFPLKLKIRVCVFIINEIKIYVSKGLKGNSVNVDRCSFWRKNKFSRNSFKSIN